MSVNRGLSILIQTCFFSRMQSVEISTEPTVYRCWKTIIAEKQSKELCKKHPSHFLHDILFIPSSKDKYMKLGMEYNMFLSIWTVSVSGHLKQKLNF